MLRTRIRAGAVAGLVMSIVAGALFTALCVGDLYLDWMGPRFGGPAPVTIRVPYGPRIYRDRTTSQRIGYEHIRVKVPRGTVLRETSDDHRVAFAYESLRRSPSVSKLISTFVVHFFLCLMLTTHLRRFSQSRARLLRTQVGFLGLLFCALVIAKGLLLFTSLPEYWIPMAALPLWIAFVFDRRTAFMLDVAAAFFAAALLRFDLLLLVVLLVRGIGATLLYYNRRKLRWQMVGAGLFAGIAGALAFVAMTIIFEGRFDLAGDLLKGVGSNVIACIGGGLAAGALARVLRDPAERMLGHVSRDKLLDLTDLEQPLLKKMAAEAPGSWEHARAMANLAEASAAAIHADALLTRVGAYYHDLGKTVQCKYFVENLTAGERSPHEDLEPDVSADAIMAHVVMGAKILRDGKIPEPIVEFAYTHHGTQLVEFFWHKCKEQGNPKGLTEDHFRYPGMKPQTKETAILMLVDSIEAASRTINPPEHKKFEEMIQRIIFTKLQAGQLDESGLTIEDLRVMTSRMASTLVNMYHGRVKYPWQREASAQAAPPSSATATPIAGMAASIARTKDGSASSSPIPASGRRAGEGAAKAKARSIHPPKSAPPQSEKEEDLKTIKDSELKTRDLGTLKTVDLAGGAPKDDDDSAASK